jgi:hypothetical protein
MNDEPIVEYLRSRARIRPPVDLVGSIADAVAGVQQQRHSWFVPLMPAAAAVAAAGVVVVAAILVQGSDAGPLGGSPTQGEVASPTSEATPSHPPAPALIEPGDTVTIDAVDADGTWGSITLTRGEDAGGRSVLGGGFFLIPVFVNYEATRPPSPGRFGTSDWALRPTDLAAVHFFHIEPVNTADTEAGRDPQPPLVQYPEAVEGASTPTEGWILFEVPGREANLELELLYWPLGAEPAATIIVREPAPAPTPLPTPTPAPGEATYVEQEGTPFTVVDSADADFLFETPDTCTNPVAGYTVTFPDDWYTNTEIGETPACSWFTPDYFEVIDPAEAPDEIWISIAMVDGTVAYTGLTQHFLNEEVLLGGMSARRVESNPSPNDRPNYRAYDYHVNMGSQDRGPSLLALVDSDAADDYELGKAVLDRIMASLDFDE